MRRYISHVKKIIYRKREDVLLNRSIITDSNKILLIKLDKLGDYILFRNFLEEAYKTYKNSGKLILCGNIAWRELAEKLDTEFISEFIWVDPVKLENDIYRYSVYKKIRKAACGIIIYCAYSRTELLDNIVLRSGAKKTIAFYGDATNISLEKKIINDAKYTTLVPGPAECMFEFYRNKLFFEYILQTKIGITKPYISVAETKADKRDNYMVIFPGAGHEVRRWSTPNFAELCKLLFNFYKMPIYVCGPESEIDYAKEIISLAGSFVVNNVGKYSLYETIEVLQRASLAITNDSGSLHLAMAINTPTVCISNGNHFERFCPYPENMNVPLSVVFPEEFELKLKDISTGDSLRCKGSEIDINRIGVNKVFDAIKNSNLVNYA